MSGDGNETRNIAASVIAGADGPLTEVHLEYRSNRRYRLLFGTPFDVIDMDGGKIEKLIASRQRKRPAESEAEAVG